ncbi:replication factor A [Methanocaldococcus bathoardescens]|uniref:Replication factor A n=1 Tax=Methanocaldococcus bathoardescens TaxID=1301915 RepID=A0A076LBK8_9EURY|nr:single-strand DNA-binding protein Rpa [Methanocaldococcus bathoardescens]AIJ05536.1 replication factor A [Methanocaldococcus bathoardescens]
MIGDYERFKKLKKKVAEALNISEEELDEMIKEKIKEFGGILLKDAALMMIAKEHGIDIDKKEEEEFLIKDIEEGQINVEITGVVTDVSDVKTFTRKDGTEGRYRKITIADKSGTIGMTLWDDLAEIDIKVGEVLKIKRARARKWGDRLELSSTSETKIEKLENYEGELPEIKDIYDIGELSPGMTATFEGEVISALPIKEFKKADGSLGRLKSFIVKDETGSIRVTLWDELTDIDVGRGDYVRVRGYVRNGYYGGLECTASNVEILKKGEKIESEEINVDDLPKYEDGELVTVKGRVIAISSKRSVDLDGEIAKVQDVLLDNGTGRVRVSFWRGKTALLENIKEGDLVRITNCRVKTYYDREGNKRADLVATADTEVVKDESIEAPEYELKYCKIEDIYNRDVDWNDINLIAQVVEDYGINEIEFENGIRKVRNLILEDGTGRIRLSLWDDLAEIEIREGDIIEILHAYAKERGDYIDLVLGKYGRIIINPEGVEIKSNRKFIADIEDGETVEVRGAVVKILSDNLFLYLCPNCKKRVVEIDGIYNCPICGDVEPEEILRLNFVVDDGTGTLLCRAYDRRVEKMLKMRREELKNLSIEMVEDEILGEEFVLYGNVRVENDELIIVVRRIGYVDVEKEIKILEEMEYSQSSN